MADDTFETVTDPVDGTVWHVDTDFVTSNWRCIWGRGCKGILPHEAEELNQGCCSHGCQMLDEQESMNTAALALLLEPERFQFHDAAIADGIFADDARTLTRVVDGACIFHNRPGFAGGEGCALHLGALDAGESPTTWKPSVCWQLPLRAETNADGSRTLRRWARTDWDDETSSIAWCCTERNEAPEAYSGDGPVLETLDEELIAMVGPEVMVELRRRHG